MKTAHKGFTLVELLIALALLGIVAAFTIPKVLQATASQEATAKLRETVSTLETAYYNKVGQNLTGSAGGIMYGQPLYATISSGINSVAQGPLGVPAGVLDPAHGCAINLGNGNQNGWIQFPNGVVVTGLANGAVLDSFPWDDPSHNFAKNYIICIDYNGNGNPNRPGQDIFVGNFNQYGGFTTVPVVQMSKAFNWGTPTTATDVVSNVALNTPASGAAPMVGCGDDVTTPSALAGARLVD